MKYILILFTLFLASCSTIQQAKSDFKNFQKTIHFNSKQTAVYNSAQF